MGLRASTTLSRPPRKVCSDMGTPRGSHDLLGYDDRRYTLARTGARATFRFLRASRPSPGSLPQDIADVAFALA